jgi:quercetin dioxygenase-like cupin family protein
MRHVNSRLAAIAAIAVAAGIAGYQRIEAQAPAQAPAVKRTVLLKQDTTVTGREAILVKVEIPPGATEGRHTHSAEVYAFVEEGTLTLDVDGQAQKTLKAGDVFTIAPGVIHEGSNRGTAPVRLSATFFAEKGKPLTTPAS